MQSEKLLNMIKQNEDHLLVDIREAYEYEHANIGGVHIPMGEILARLDEIPNDKPVVIHCQSGSRGEKLCKLLRSLGYANVLNLEGGIEAYLQTQNQR